MPVKTIVGLDIGSTHIRGVEATIKNGQPYITGFASIPLDAGIVSFGEITDASALTQALALLWKNGKFSSVDVRVVVNGENNVATLLTFDDEKDFRQTLPFKIPKSVLNVDEYYISYHTINIYAKEEVDKTKVSGKRQAIKRDILLVGSKKDTTDLLIKSLRNAGLRPISIDIAPLAILRAETVPGTEDEIDIHINIGATMTTIIVSHKNQPVYLRNIADLGGNNITKAIMARLECGRPEAEELKRQVVDMKAHNHHRAQEPDAFAKNIFEDENEIQTTEYSANQIEAYAAVMEVISGIVHNIQATVEFFMQSNNAGLGDTIGQIFVSGGTAKFEQIRNRLAREIGRGEATLSQPIAALAATNQVAKTRPEIREKEHEYVLAIGAALAKGEDKN